MTTHQVKLIGAIALHPLYAFMAWTSTVLPAVLNETFFMSFEVLVAQAMKTQYCGMWQRVAWSKVTDFSSEITSNLNMGAVEPTDTFLRILQNKSRKPETANLLCLS